MYVLNGWSSIHRMLNVILDDNISYSTTTIDRTAVTTLTNSVTVGDTVTCQNLPLDDNETSSIKWLTPHRWEQYICADFPRPYRFRWDVHLVPKIYTNNFGHSIRNRKWESNEDHNLYGYCRSSIRK